LTSPLLASLPGHEITGGSRPRRRRPGDGLSRDRQRRI